jgi:hypothetical protein
VCVYTRTHTHIHTHILNAGYMMAGDLTKRMDPYFPFEKSVEVLNLRSLLVQKYK